MDLEKSLTLVGLIAMALAVGVFGKYFSWFIAGMFDTHYVPRSTAWQRHHQEAKRTALAIGFIYFGVTLLLLIKRYLQQE